MTIRWITPLLGTAPAQYVLNLPDLHLVDVRDLVDKPGNRADAINEKIRDGVCSVQKGQKTIVCCDYGISRSNAIAAGILANVNEIAFNEAVRIVQQTTGENEIKLGPLDAVRIAMGIKASSKDKSDKRSILITGANGFIGTLLCDRLKQDFNVIAPSRSEIDIEKGSTQLSLLAHDHAVDCIVHLANPRVYTSNLALGSTLSMLRNVLEVCVSSGATLVYPSSWEIYSGYSGSLHANEATPPFPKGPYGETKYLTELMISHWLQTTPLKCCILRSSPLYGNGASKPKFIYNFLDKALKSQEIATHKYKNGDPKLDLLSVIDFVECLYRTISEEYTGDLNIGSGNLISTYDTALLISEIVGNKVKISRTEIEDTAPSISMNSEKARKDISWNPIHHIKDFIQEIANETVKER